MGSGKLLLKWLGVPPPFEKRFLDFQKLFILKSLKKNINNDIMVLSKG